MKGFSLLVLSLILCTLCDLAGAQSCSVSYAIVNSWSGGFQAGIAIQNTGTAPINGWTVVWTFPGNQQIAQLWGGTVTSQGETVTVTSLSWDANIAPGGTMNSVGFTANVTGTNTVPTGFILNGVACGGGGGGNPGNPPPAPTGLAATAGDGQVTLSWDLSTGATSYIVGRSTTTGGPYTRVATPTVTSFTDTNVTNGTTYFYVVAAANTTGASLDSAQVTATPSGSSTPPGSSFGVTSNGGLYIVDTGAGLVFKINQSNGDMTSVRLNGIELNDQSKASGIASGLGSATVTATQFGSSYIKITVQTNSSNAVVSNLTHYYIARNGFNNIYMATYITSEPAVGELRYIFRAKFDELPNGPPHSNNDGNTGAIESTDVFGRSDRTTTSKYYGNSRALELTNSFQGASGNGIGAWMYYGVNRESSSGGPFFHDIENQGDGAGSDQEIYNYMNSGHNQTEANRINVLNGPYALCFTAGGPPNSAPDLSFISTLGLTGYVPNSSRGFVFGKASGVLSGVQAVVGFSNSSAQYWVIPDPNTNNFSGPMMKTGSYTMTLYQGELAVATNSITVNTGGNQINITAALPQPATIWRVGTWDGKPTEFLNGQNINIMHPSDVRNSNWGPVTFTVGTSLVSSFPAVQFRGANTPTTIRFGLTSAQVAGHTLRIGITAAYNNGRPVITMNPGTSNAWTSATPSASSQPKSRSITIGTYRGNESIFTYSIPASAFVAGTNVMQITVASGSSDLSEWLSASWVYDCIELDN